MNLHLSTPDVQLFLSICGLFFVVQKHPEEFGFLLHSALLRGAGLP